MLAISFFTPFPLFLRILLYLGWGTGVFFWFWKLGREHWYAPFLIGYAVILILWQFKLPSYDREWEYDHVRITDAEFNGNLVTVKNLRNARHTGPSSAEMAWDTRTYNLDEIERMDFLIVPFGEWEGPAHTFLTFGFKGDTYLSVSVEARREKGEPYNVFKGMFREYELMYVIGDELDMIGVRTEYYGDKVYLFPVKITKEQMKDMFVSMLREAAAVYDKPVWYNTLTRSCTTEIVMHMNKFRKNKIIFDLGVVFPGYSDRLAFELGLIDVPEPYEEHRSDYYINDRADIALESKAFSRKIREKASNQ